jgi:hypothetical protein
MNASLARSYRMAVTHQPAAFDVSVTVETGWLEVECGVLEPFESSIQVD